jgi:hypothetical protein
MYAPIWSKCVRRKHRNLRSRICTYVGTGLANILGERTPCKKLADLHPRQGNLLQRNNFSVVYVQNLSSLHKIGWRPAEKFPPFFNMRVLYLDFYGWKKLLLCTVCTSTDMQTGAINHVSIAQGSATACSNAKFLSMCISAGLPDVIHICIPKISIRVHIFWRVCNWKCWFILLHFGIFYGHWIKFVFILWSIGTFLPV